jgi:hypothetical protein
MEASNTGIIFCNPVRRVIFTLLHRQASVVDRPLRFKAPAQWLARCITNGQPLSAYLVTESRGCPPEDRQSRRDE